MDKLTVERSIWIAAPRERVWEAVTNPTEIARWFSPGTDITQREDGTISVRIGDTDIDVAMIEVVDPPRQVTSRSLPDRALTTTFTLEEVDGGTRVTVTMAGFESLPEDTRRERLVQDDMGWEMALANLQAYIEGRSLPRPEGF